MVIDRSIRAVIFDMDGLLLDSERIALAVVAEAAAELGLPWREEVGLAMVGLTSRDSDLVVRRHLGEDFPMDRLREAFGRRYERAIQSGRILPKPGAAEILDLLDALGTPRMVATSTMRSRAVPKLASAGLLDRFHGLVCGDEVSRGKPDPEIFLTAASRLGVPPTDCLVLEDSNAGIRGALAAGMLAVMVPDMLQPAEDVLAAGVFRATSLLEVCDLLSRN